VNRLRGESPVGERAPRAVQRGSELGIPRAGGGWRAVTALALSAAVLWMGACTDLREPGAEEGDAKAADGAVARAVEPVVSFGRADTTRKGSLLIYPHVEVKWNADGSLRQDTFLEVSNDFPGDVELQFYLVNGDAPVNAVVEGDPPQETERSHPGWNVVDIQLRLTGDEATYWSALTGLPKGVSPLTVLDPGLPRGRPDPDPDNPGGRVLRGYVIGWAVTPNGHEIRWNHLKGSAVIVDYGFTAAWEYPAWAFQVSGVPHGEEPASCLTFNLDSGRCVEIEVVPGRMDLDGFEYDACPGKLLLDFLAVGSSLNSGLPGIGGVTVDTNLTLLSCSVDLRQDNNGPITTKAKFDIWNENEARFSGTERCVTCWDSTPLVDYTELGIPNHFLAFNLQTVRGRARIDGLGSTVCNREGVVSTDAPLLGVAQRVLRFGEFMQTDEKYEKHAPDVDKTGEPLVGQGEEVARILYDIVGEPEELHGDDGK